jgi:hypothetical protein
MMMDVGGVATTYYNMRYDALDWKKEVNKLTGEKQFNLIILDTARYDYFSQEYEKYLDGKLKKAISPASATIGTISETFDEKKDLTYFSSIPMVNSQKIEVQPELFHTLSFRPWDMFREVVDVWDFGWNDELSTVPPSALNEAVLDRNDDKKIIHYCQPHGNWIAGPQVFVDPDKTMTERVLNDEVSPAKLRKAYRNNLKLGLKYTSKLIENLEGKTIVTADHGELLGEFGIYGQHPLYLPASKLRIVPWLEVQ